MNIAVLSGGVGGGRFACGLARVVDPAGLTIIVNTGDDDDIRGLSVSPDVDSVLYHLAGLCDWERGWGIAGDTFSSDERFKALARDVGIDVQDWFALGDLDLATHMLRTTLLARGLTLSRAIDVLRRSMGIACRVIPMSDARTPTRIVTRDGRTLAFEEYFVKLRQDVDIERIELGSAATAPGAVEAIASADVVLFAPSNPLVSIGPILALPAIRTAVEAATVPRVGVSPIIGGRTLKGPAARMLASLGHEPTALGAASIYKGLLDAWVLDHTDADLAEAVEQLGMRAIVLDTLMRSPEGAARLAKETLEEVLG